ncbi:hypothetical protein H5410_027191 [Solanum commersonii]|uniref:Reverse transcriptase n=1 Tax=Solanum commersonii TaxID=4109 RepID=A0A9J5YYC6_SOLCO|nr:hypothetical protein H5410_027191 [Solanum commersonii]
MISEEWDTSFNNIKQSTLQRLASDHVPVSLQGGRWIKNKRYFKFENWWLTTTGFKDRVQDWWSSLSLSGKLDYILAYDNLEDRPLSEENAMNLQLEELIKREEISWRQKSRALWRIEGDKNTKFFHRISNAHKRFNNIDQLMIQGEVSEDPVRIEEAIIEFYQNLYTESAQWRPTIVCHDCPVLSNDEKEKLQRRFDEEEVPMCLNYVLLIRLLGQMGIQWASLAVVGN